LSKFERTQHQWPRLTGLHPSYMRAGQRSARRTFTLQHAVEQVTWLEAAEVCRCLGLVFPTDHLAGCR
jgi:formylglycine-generating enzyme required for sulfatase activity